MKKDIKQTFKELFGDSSDDSETEETTPLTDDTDNSSEYYSKSPNNDHELKKNEGISTFTTDMEIDEELESLPSTSDMSWTPTDNTSNFFSAQDTNSSTDSEADSQPSDNTSDDSDSDADSDSDSDSDTFFRKSDDENEDDDGDDDGNSPLSEYFVFDDDDDDVDENPQKAPNNPSNDESPVTEIEMIDSFIQDLDSEDNDNDDSDKEHDDDDDDDDDVALVNSLKRGVKNLRTKHDNTDYDNDESNFHMVFKRMRLDPYKK